MSTADSSAARCGIDAVELARFENFLRDTPPAELVRIFSARELEEAGAGPGRIASLAGRFAAKEACCKLFPRELALGTIGVEDFAVRRDPYGAPVVEPSPRAQVALDRHRLAGLQISLTHTAASASAIAVASRRPIEVPWFGAALYHFLPLRRGVVMDNLRRVFGEVLPASEIRRLAQAYYAHFGRFLMEFIRLPFMSRKRREAWIRIENKEAPIRAYEQGKGLLLLTGHFGNWEVATVAGIGQFPQYRGLFHFVRRPLKPRWLNTFVNRRFRAAGFGTLPKQGSLEDILNLLEKGNIIVYVFDQHAGGKEGIPVEFFGHPAGTFKSLALLAMSTGSPVIPASSWREPDGTHVLRFEEPLPLVECENVSEAIRLNTRIYNEALERLLLRHPEQWIWMHRRWKLPR